MIKIDPYFLYQVGAAIRPLTTVQSSLSKNSMRSRLWGAQHWLDTFLNNSVYRLQTCRESGDTLLATIQRILAKYEAQEAQSADKLNEEVGWVDSYFIESQSNSFETVLSAELRWGQLYLVEPKGGFDLNQLTENGIVIFPSELASKVPESIQDARDAARCVAFALPTAAAFHMHRLNELVLRRFYDAVTGGKPRPENRNIGAYIDAMKNHKFNDKKLFSALAALKDFHRNPVLHPDDRLENVEEAIALLGSINTVITHMLKELQPAPLVLTPPPSPDEAKAIEQKTQEV